MKQLGRRGLTLMEILVVVAVIAILAGILFPILTGVKASAHKARCSSNLFQLGSAFTMYVSDWNGLYPSPGGLRGDFNYWSQSGPGGLRPYVGNTSGGFGTIWCCPLMREWDCPYPVRSYGMNSFLRTPADVAYPGCVRILRPIRKVAVTVPEQTILLYEGSQILVPVPSQKPEYLRAGIYVYRCGNWEEVRGWYPGPANGMISPHIPMHGPMNNYLYCDGHVRSRPPGKYKADGVHNVTWAEAGEWLVNKEKYRHMFP